VTLRITYGPWGETLDEMVAAARAAESAGAEVLWVPELHRSATISAAAIAANTEYAAVGTAIALAFTRSPMVTALEAIDLDEMAKGRFILGLGTGVQRLNELWHNAQWGKPVGHMRETVRNIRTFIEKSSTGEVIDLPGEYEPMQIRGYQRPFIQTRTNIPIYLGAMGSTMTKLVGEIGDGWISHELCSPKYLSEQLIPWLKEGMEREKRPSESVDVVVSALCAVDSNGARARRWAAGTVGFYASVKTYEGFFGFHDLAAEQATVIEAFRSGVAADHLGDHVPDHMVDALTIAGTPGQVIERISDYDGIANTIKITPPTHGLSATDTRASQEKILKMIPELTGH
jgi:alkanesulfonate monooxygenase SsuD/methylene tetrahydromethanopterin reductase-like flavin-dependent oxidoreductase (luciferase family)